MASRTEANGNTRLVHFLDLDEYGLEDIAEDQKGAAKREVADFLKNQVLREVSAGSSPVKGEGRFRILDPEYARREKGGRRISDLELEGDLKDSLVSTPSTGSFIKYGHEGAQVPKSDGHNQISEKAKAWARKSKHPKRRYIPDDGQKFDDSILGGIRNILEGYVVNTPARDSVVEDDDDFFSGTTDIRPTSTARADSTSDLFSDDVISDLLDDAFRRRGVF